MAGRYKTHYPIRRQQRGGFNNPPWGYDQAAHDPDLFLPNEPLLRMLEQAERAWLLGTSSHSEIARWLSKKSGRPISRQGLMKRLFIVEPKLKRRAIRPAGNEEAAE